MKGVDLWAAARIDDAIEATGATVIDFDVVRRPPQTPGEALASSLGGHKPAQFQFTVDPKGLAAVDTERADAPADVADRSRSAIDAVEVDFLARMLDAAEGMPVDPGLTAAQNLRAVLGQMDGVDDPDRLMAAASGQNDDQDGDDDDDGFEPTAWPEDDGGD